jgi:hypothetical protein
MTGAEIEACWVGIHAHNMAGLTSAELADLVREFERLDRECARMHALVEDRMTLWRLRRAKLIARRQMKQEIRAAMAALVCQEA